MNTKVFNSRIHSMLIPSESQVYKTRELIDGEELTIIVNLKRMADSPLNYTIEGDNGKPAVIIIKNGTNAIDAFNKKQVTYTFIDFVAKALSYTNVSAKPMVKSLQVDGYDSAKINTLYLPYSADELKVIISHNIIDVETVDGKLQQKIINHHSNNFNATTETSWSSANYVAKIVTKDYISAVMSGNCTLEQLVEIAASNKYVEEHSSENTKKIATAIPQDILNMI